MLFIGNKKEFVYEIAEANKEQMQVLSKSLEAIKSEQQNVKTERENIEREREALSVLESGFKTAGAMVEELKTQRGKLDEIKAESERMLVNARKCIEESEKNRKKIESFLQQDEENRRNSAKMEEKRKKKAAMALNLCAASISNIIACGNVETMEIEYNTILNNINLQAIVKDEALLTTMRNILDTVNFFRLQEGDRNRLEERHRQRMNNLLWDSLSSAGGLFVVGDNPWAIGAAAALQAGSMFVGYNRKKQDEKMQFDDEIWKLERSALEQLHALRASLFETAWRLSDTYDFKDEWRLTISQIDWFNEIRMEPDDLIRYKKLEQYKTDFEVYPYYWYELGVAAHSVYENSKKKGGKCDDPENWKKKALDCFREFLEKDEEFGLLRQNMIGADAGLRHVELLAESNRDSSPSLGWAIAVKQDVKYLERVKRLAVDDPELLMKAALIYASAYQEMKKLADSEQGNSAQESAKTVQSLSTKDQKDWGEKAIEFFEMLVLRGSNLPMSSIYLSHLCLEMDNRKKYSEWKDYARRQETDAIILVSDDTDKETRESVLKESMDLWRTGRCRSLKELFDGYFDIVLKLAHRDIFNCDPIQQRENIYNWIKDNENNIQNGIYDFLEPVKREINASFIYAEQSLGFESTELHRIANQIDSEAKRQIVLFQEREFYKIGNYRTDYYIVTYNLFIGMLELLRCLYSFGLLDVIEGETKDRDGNRLSPNDVTVLLDFHLKTLISRCSLVGLNGYYSNEKERKDYFCLIYDPEDPLCSNFKDNGKFSFEVLINYAAAIDYIYREKWSCMINCDGCSDDEFKHLMLLFESRYPKEKTSFRRNLTQKYESLSDLPSIGIEWADRMAKETKALLLGHEDFEITFMDKNIEVKYKRRDESEHSMSVERMTPEQLKLEIRRLAQIFGIFPDKDARLKECFAHWVNRKKEDNCNETDPKKKQSLIERFNRELKMLWLPQEFLSLEDIKKLLPQKTIG
jgi:hypothetical protein